MLASYHSSLSQADLQARIDQVIHLCKQLDSAQQMADMSPPCYAKTLQLMRERRAEYDGLRLEACRALISNFVGAGGDILRMGANAVREGQAMFDGRDTSHSSGVGVIHGGGEAAMDPTKTKTEKWRKRGKERSDMAETGRQDLAEEWPPEISRRFFLSEFPANSTAVFQDSIRRMFLFLLRAPAPLGGRPFWINKLTLEGAVRIASRAGQLRTPLPSALNTASRDEEGGGEGGMQVLRFGGEVWNSGGGQVPGGQEGKGTTKRRLQGSRHSFRESRQTDTKSGSSLPSSAASLGSVPGKVRMYSSFRGQAKVKANTHSPYKDSPVGVLSSTEITGRARRRSRDRHVTHHMWSVASRQQYIDMLSHDAVLGPILNLIRNILYLPLPYVSSDIVVGSMLYNYSAIY